MALADVVEQLVAPVQLSGEALVLAAALRSAAELADGEDATPAGRLRAQQTVIDLLDRWSEVGARPGLPRIGRLTGESARAMALALGYPPDQVDRLDLPYGFDAIEAMRLQNIRRRAKLPVQPALQAMVDDRIARGEKVSVDEGNGDDG